MTIFYNRRYRLIIDIADFWATTYLVKWTFMLLD